VGKETPFCPKKSGASQFEHQWILSVLTVRVVQMRSLFFQAKLLTSVITGMFCIVWGSKSAVNIRNYGVTRPVLCSQCSNFWTRKRDFAPPPSLLLRFCLLLFLLVSDNEVIATRTSFTGYPWNERKASDCPRLQKVTLSTDGNGAPVVLPFNDYG